MVIEMSSTVKIFYSYSPADAQLRRALANQLHHRHIEHLYDRLVQPGMEREEEIDNYLDTADIILLLISPDFMSSEYNFGRVVKRALERYRKKEARVIPIVLRPVEWKSTPLG